MIFMRGKTEGDCFNWGTIRYQRKACDKRKNEVRSEGKNHGRAIEEPWKRKKSLGGGKPFEGFCFRKGRV
jgi:hypothetical protein